ncbi:MAG: prepilin-type N-terminal cleavage/methylation domain-containing protein [Phycisphaerales bacterium JB041]
MRAFTLLECMASVALIAMAAAAVAVRVSPSVNAARLDDTRSVLLLADARARSLAAGGSAATLSCGQGRVTIRSDGGGFPVILRRLPDGVSVSLLAPETREDLRELRIDRLGQSADYVIAIRTDARRSETLVAGLTGYAFAPEVSRP